MGIQFQDGQVDAGLSFALGVEVVHPLDLIRAYGVLGDKGRHRRPDDDHHGHRQQRQAASIETTPRPKPAQVLDQGAAYITTDILAGNTNPNKNPFWGQFAIKDGGNAAARRRSRRAPATRPATSTPTGTSARRTTTGRKDGEYALAVGAWNGNSDNSLVSKPGVAAVLDRRHDLRLAGVPRGGDQGLVDQRVRAGARHGIDRASVDPWTGLAAEPGGAVGRRAVPRRHAPTAPCCRPRPACGVAVLSNAGFEDEHAAWLAADHGWLTRAEHGPGTRGGPQDTRTSYFYNGLYTPYGRSWGALVGGEGCAQPSPSPSASIDPCASPLAPADPSASPSGRRRVPVRSAPPTEAPIDRPRPSRRRSRPTPDARRRPPTPTPTPTPTPVAIGARRRRRPRPRVAGRPVSAPSQRIPAYDPPGRDRFEGPGSRAIVDLSPFVERGDARVVSRFRHHPPASPGGQGRHAPRPRRRHRRAARATRDRRRRPHRHDAVPGGRGRARLDGVVQPHVTVPSAERVDLKTAGVPAGWTARFRGGGLTIDSVYVEPEDPADLTLDVEIPDGAPPRRRNTITVTATGGGQTDALPLSIRVADAAAGNVIAHGGLRPDCKGPSSTTFTFNLTLHNDTVGRDHVHDGRGRARRLDRHRQARRPGAGDQRRPSGRQHRLDHASRRRRRAT